MVLSNTATPRYFAEFREQVRRGKIPVCEEIQMEMKRIEALIKDRAVYYDPDAVEGWIRFCENELVLPDGSPFAMLPSFKMWGEQVYGWYYFVDTSVFVKNPDGIGGHFETRKVKKRLTKVQYIILGRSGAKSMYMTCHQAYTLAVDRRTTAQVVTAPTMRQANEVVSPLLTALARPPGPYFQFMTAGSKHNTTGQRINRKLLDNSSEGVKNFLTNSVLEIRPMSIDKLQGRRDAMATVDEWLSGDTNEDVVEALEQGADKVDGLVIAASSEGTIRNSVGDTKKMELLRILKGEEINPYTSIFYYRLDDISEVGDPNMWLKAQPNLGATVSYETYHRAVEKAEANPSLRNDILAKRFGIPMEGYTYYFTYEETKVHRKRDYWRMSCAMGIDLSQGDDFCAFTFLFPLPNGRFGIKTRCYISSRTLMMLPAAARAKYEEFLQEGSLIVLDGSVLDMMDVYDDLVQHLNETEYTVEAVGYDPYNAKDFISRWEQEMGPLGVEKVIQGARTESVPLGELKILATDRRLLFDQLLFQYAMGNSIALEDTNGNRKLYKARREQKIDAVAAMMDAYVAYKLHRDLFT